MLRDKKNVDLEYFKYYFHFLYLKYMLHSVHVSRTISGDGQPDSFLGRPTVISIAMYLTSRSGVDSGFLKRKAGGGAV